MVWDVAFDDVDRDLAPIVGGGVVVGEGFGAKCTCFS